MGRHAATTDMLGSTTDQIAQFFVATSGDEVSLRPLASEDILTHVSSVVSFFPVVQ